MYIRLLIVILAWGFLAEGVHAQARRRYQPSRPIVSPYLNLLPSGSRNRPNYQLLVRPQIQQRTINRETSRLIANQGERIVALQQRASSLPIPQMTPATFRGAGGYFRGSALYYPRYQPPQMMSRR